MSHGGAGGFRARLGGDPERGPGGPRDRCEPTEPARSPAAGIAPNRRRHRDRFLKQPGLPLGAGGFGGAVSATRCSLPSGAGSATGAGARSGAWLRPPLGAAIDR
jgi:hypothetical protein